MRKLMFILSLFLLFISLIVIDNDYVNVYASNNEYNIIFVLRRFYLEFGRTCGRFFYRYIE